MRLTLKTAILRSGRTQRAVSLKLRIPETRLSSIVRGRVEPDDRERKALVRFFHTDADVLLHVEREIA